MYLISFVSLNSFQARIRFWRWIWRWAKGKF